MVNVGALVTNVILVIVAIIVIFQIIGSTAPALVGASGNISSSGLPLASLFSSTGIVMLIFMAGILLAVIVIALRMSKMGK